MTILNSLPKKIGVATTNTNGLMSADDKIAVNKINRIEEDVANKLNKDCKIKSSQLDTSHDEFKIKEENLSNEVKAMMTGNTPISQSFEYGSLVTEYYANSSVTSSKRTPGGSFACIVSSDFCNFDTTPDTEVILSIPKDYTVYFGTTKKVIENIPETITLEKGVASVITYHESDGFRAYDIQCIDEFDYIIGAFDGNYVTMFNGKYTVNDSIVIANGSLDGSAIKDFSLDAKKLAIQHCTIVSDVTNSPYLNVNFKYNFIEVVKEFDINIADQVIMSIREGLQCIIDENINNNKYLYIYYDLGSRSLCALWSSNDINQSIISDKKLILIGIVTKEKAVGINSKYISVGSISIKNKDISYTNILSGNIIIDLKTKKITSDTIKLFINNQIISFATNIVLTDKIITNITNGIPYTLAATREDLNVDTYKLVFDLTSNVKSIGLDAIILSSINKYEIYNNKEFITIIKPDGNIVKSNNAFSIGYILPIDNQTIINKLATVNEDGNLILTSTTVPGTSIVDSINNIKYDITEESIFTTTINNLHGLYCILFNTENNKIEIISQSEFINKKKYIFLGFINELSDSLSYTVSGNILEHITLNSNRPSNYSISDGPDPDKGYDWTNNRLVLPNDLYLLKNTQYTFYCQNMSMNRYIDNDYINYELALPNGSILTENILNINIPVEGTFDTMIAGKFKGNNNCLYKDITLNISSPSPKELSILCIGDETVDMNMPGYIKKYLSDYGYTPTMLGTVNNGTSINGYGLKGLSNENGEGHRGWRVTDFMCRTLRKDNSSYYIPNNPFENNHVFDFSKYMNTNSYNNVDVVVISMGLNDILGNHNYSTIEDINNLSIGQIIEQLPNLYIQMISSIHAFKSNIKIIINPTMIKGIDDDFNKKSLMLTEALFYDLKDIENVYFVPGYLSQPLFAGTNKVSISSYTESSDINNTKLGSSTSSIDINGMAQSNLSYMIASTIISITK